MLTRAGALFTGLLLVLALGAFTRTSISKRIAIRRWGNVCHGHVRIHWGRVANPDWVAQAHISWLDETDPSTYYNCVVTWNPAYRAGDTFPVYCTGMVHEYGHLAGMHHSPDPRSVMYWRYVRPFPACERAWRSLRSH